MAAGERRSRGYGRVQPWLHASAAAFGESSVTREAQVDRSTSFGGPDGPTNGYPGGPGLHGSMAVCGLWPRVVA
eukprot:4906286-Pyramimonas_sp.AAC.1